MNLNSDCETKEWTELRQYLLQIPDGPIDDAGQIPSLLAPWWEELVGGMAEGMDARKLFNRMKDIYWSSPFLSFIIEHDRGFVCGSSRADLYDWLINVENRTAECITGRHRQVLSKSPRLDVAPLAMEMSICPLVASSAVEMVQ